MKIDASVTMYPAEQQTLQAVMRSINISEPDPEDEDRRALNMISKGETADPIKARQALRAAQLHLEVCEEQSTVEYWEEQLPTPDPRALVATKDTAKPVAAAPDHLRPEGDVPLIANLPFARETLAAARSLQAEEAREAIKILASADERLSEMIYSNITPEKLKRQMAGYSGKPPLDVLVREVREEAAEEQLANR